MQTLVFNTTTKSVKVYEGVAEESLMSYTFDNIPTVKVKDLTYYEVIQKEANDEGLESNFPIARFPIANTNMIIQR
jgi:hypothetical protein